MSVTTIDPQEVEHFSKMAADWWDPTGPFAPLHRIAPERLGYVRDAIAAHYGRQANDLRAFAGLSILDIGCGGGLIAEPLARLGGDVTGIDATEKNLHTARAHAAGQGLEIAYRHTGSDQLVREGVQFDAVLALEVLEHVADVRQFLLEAAQLAKPGGIVLLSTLNRTPQAFLKAIVGAEYILRWLPKGTHHWRKFLTPAEVTRLAESVGLTVTDVTGLSMHPLTFRWQLGTDVSVNYFVTCVKGAA